MAGEVFFAGLDGRLPLDLFPFFLGPAEDHAGLLFGLGGLAGALLPLEQQDRDGRGEDDDNGDAGVRQRVHWDDLLIYSK